MAPSMGDIRPHGHLKLGRFTQHFVDVLDLEQTPLDFFESKYPNDPREEQRKYLGRFGVSGKMQVQKMAELSDGQKSRVVFAKLGRDVPHILLLDEPTNHLVRVLVFLVTAVSFVSSLRTSLTGLYPKHSFVYPQDMESIDALAKAVNEFEGGLVLVSHDMRLISQVANEIWICDNKTITKYKGDIQRFKMDMRAQMGIEGEQQGTKLRGDASVQRKDTDESAPKKAEKTTTTKISVVKPVTLAPSPKAADDDAATMTTASTTSSATTSANSGGRYIPPHLRKKLSSSS